MKRLAPGAKSPPRCVLAVAITATEFVPTFTKYLLSPALSARLRGGPRTREAAEQALRTAGQYVVAVLIDRGGCLAGLFVCAFGDSRPGLAANALGCGQLNGFGEGGPEAVSEGSGVLQISRLTSPLWPCTVQVTFGEE